MNESRFRVGLRSGATSAGDCFNLRHAEAHDVGDLFVTAGVAGGSDGGFEGEPGADVGEAGGEELVTFGGGVGMGHGASWSNVCSSEVLGSSSPRSERRSASRTRG